MRNFGTRYDSVYSNGLMSELNECQFELYYDFFEIGKIDLKQISSYTKILNNVKLDLIEKYAENMHVNYLEEVV